MLHNATTPYPEHAPSDAVCEPPGITPCPQPSWDADMAHAEDAGDMGWVFGTPGCDQVTLDILSWLDYRPLLACSAVSRHLNDLITTSSRLQVCLRRAFYCLRDIPRHGGKAPSSRAALERMIQVQEGWHTVRPRRVDKIDIFPQRDIVPPPPATLVVDGVLVAFDARSEQYLTRHFRRWAVHDLSELRDIDASVVDGPAQCPCWRWEEGEREYWDAAILPSENLIALLELGTQEAEDAQPTPPRVHFRRLMGDASAGADYETPIAHPVAIPYVDIKPEGPLSPRLPVPISVTFARDGTLHVYMRWLGQRGYHFGRDDSSSSNASFHYCYRKMAVDWKTGTTWEEPDLKLALLQARPTQHFFGDVRDGILPSHRSAAGRCVVAIDSRQGTPNTLSVGDFHTRAAGSDMVRAGLPLGTRFPRCAATPSTVEGQTRNEGKDTPAGPAPNACFKTVGGVTWHETRNPQDWEMRTLGYASADMRGRDTPARVRWHASGDHWNPKEEHTKLRRTGRSVKIGWYALCHGETLHVDEEHIYVHQRSLSAHISSAWVIVLSF